MNNIANVYGDKNKKSINDIIKKYSNSTIEDNALESAKPWSGFRELELVDRINECDDIVSFYFKAKDGKKLIKHKAGQFLPLKIKTNDDKYKEQIRTYSLSMKPNEDIYRISVKKVNGGLISTYLHENLKVGDIIEAMVPAGLFTLSNDVNTKPLVLISAGIGITPLISMLYDSIGKINDITFAQAVLNSKNQPFKEDIKIIAESNNIKSYALYSNPLEDDKIGVDYDAVGFITKEWIEKHLPLNGEYYFCGPPPFMKVLNKALIELGVERKNIHFEFFGDPQSMK